MSINTKEKVEDPLRESQLATPTIEEAEPEDKTDPESKAEASVMSVTSRTNSTKKNTKKLKKRSHKLLKKPQYNKQSPKNLKNQLWLSIIKVKELISTLKQSKERLQSKDKSTLNGLRSKS